MTDKEFFLQADISLEIYDPQVISMFGLLNPEIVVGNE